MISRYKGAESFGIVGSFTVPGNILLKLVHVCTLSVSISMTAKIHRLAHKAQHSGQRRHRFVEDVATPKMVSCLTAAMYSPTCSFTSMQKNLSIFK